MPEEIFPIKHPPPFFFLFCKTDFYPFPLLASRFNPSRAAGAAAAAALKFIFPPGRGFRIRLVVSPLVAAETKEGKTSSCGRIGKVF